MALIDEQFMIAYDRLERKNITDRIAIFSDSYECTKHQHTLQQIVPKIKYWKQHQRQIYSIKISIISNVYNSFKEKAIIIYQFVLIAYLSLIIQNLYKTQNNEREDSFKQLIEFLINISFRDYLFGISFDEFLVKFILFFRTKCHKEHWSVIVSTISDSFMNCIFQHMKNSEFFTDYLCNLQAINSFPFQQFQIISSKTTICIFSICWLRFNWSSQIPCTVLRRNFNKGNKHGLDFRIIIQMIFLIVDALGWSKEKSIAMNNLTLSSIFKNSFFNPVIELLIEFIHLNVELIIHEDVKPNSSIGCMINVMLHSVINILNKFLFFLSASSFGNYSNFLYSFRIGFTHIKLIISKQNQWHLQRNHTCVQLFVYFINV